MKNAIFSNTIVLVEIKCSSALHKKAVKQREAGR